MTHTSIARYGFGAESPALYLEDFAVGQVDTAGPPDLGGCNQSLCPTVRPAAYPHWRGAGTLNFLPGLAASGWHTASLTMSLVVQALPIGGGVIGGGVIGGGLDELRRPGGSSHPDQP